MLEMEAAGIRRYARRGDRLWTQCHVFSKNEYGSVSFCNQKAWKCFVNLKNLLTFKHLIV